MKTCFNCKYYMACGDDERTAPCEGKEIVRYADLNVDAQLKCMCNYRFEVFPYDDEGNWDGGTIPDLEKSIEETLELCDDLSINVNGEWFIEDTKIV